MKKLILASLIFAGIFGDSYGTTLKEAYYAGELEEVNDDASAKKLIDDGVINIEHSHKDGRVASHDAAQINRTEFLRVLKNNFGYSLGERTLFNETPLHLAAYEGNPEAVDELISLGADINVKTKFPVSNEKVLNWDNKTPLEYAQIRQLRYYHDRETAENANLEAKVQQLNEKIKKFDKVIESLQNAQSEIGYKTYSNS